MFLLTLTPSLYPLISPLW